MSLEESQDSDDSDLARRTRREWLHSRRQLLVELRDNPAVKDLLADLRSQREATEEAIFLQSDQYTMGTLVEREQLIGQRRGLLAVEVWFDGRLVEIDEELKQLATLNPT